MKLVLSSGSSKYGAQMGRGDTLPENLNEPIKLRLERLRWVSYDYDQFGAYWGHTPNEFIYCAFTDGYRMFVRANNRDKAKRLVRETLSQAKFYR